MKIITTIICAAFLAMVSTTTFAQSNAETAALDVVEKYWQARNEKDFATQNRLEWFIAEQVHEGLLSASD